VPPPRGAGGGPVRRPFEGHPPRGGAPPGGRGPGGPPDRDRRRARGGRMTTEVLTRLEAMATALDEAAVQRRALTHPLTDDDAGLDAATAYEIQRLVVAKRVERGARVVGAKLGLTSAAKQRQMAVSEPLYGWLTSDMVVDPSQPVDLDVFIHVRAEPEIAFLIGRELAAPATVASVLAATDAVFAAIELIDSRYEAFRFRHPDVIADNASS